MKLISGFILDRYKIGEFLASGSTADVYSCYPAKEADMPPAERHRFVAKVFKFPTDLAQYDRRKRLFYKEIETIEHLNANIHIVRILAQGCFLDEKSGLETPYCVLPRLTGGTLTSQIKNAPLSIEEGLKIGIGLADALHYAHKNGILHCDVKPDNVMLDESKNPVWIDFGVAKEYDPSEEGASVMSEVGKVAVGTAPYMSPEHFRGRHTLCPASDIWSMGALLTRILTKKFPFGKEFEQVRQRIKTQSWHDFTDLMKLYPQELADLPKDLQFILDKCLRVSLDERYTSALALKNDLEAVLRGVPIGNYTPNIIETAELEAPVSSGRNWIFPFLGGVASLGVVTYFLLPFFNPPVNSAINSKPKIPNLKSQTLNPKPQAPNNPTVQNPTVSPQNQPIIVPNNAATNPPTNANNGAGSILKPDNSAEVSKIESILVQFVPQSGYNPQKTRVNGTIINPNIGLMQPFEGKMGQTLSWEIEATDQTVVKNSLKLPQDLQPNQVIRVNWQTGGIEK